MTRAGLENYGDTVTAAVTGREALTGFREDPRAIPLVLADHALPFMDGDEMIKALRKVRADITIIITSGS
jgi:CheY-like chemotaxis protein